MRPIEALARRIAEAEAAGEDPYGEMPIEQLQRLAARSSAALPKVLAAERLVNGIGVKGPADRDYSEYAAAREKAESMTRQELEEFLLGPEDERASG
jgi:hypothetical protein